MDYLGKNQTDKFDAIIFEFVGFNQKRDKVRAQLLALSFEIIHFHFSNMRSIMISRDIQTNYSSASNLSPLEETLDILMTIYHCKIQVYYFNY